MGIVHLVGAGPGDPELLTLKAARLLAACDVCVYDRLAHPSLLDYLPAGAERLYVGKERACHTVRQEEINGLLVARALRGLTVVRLKGGDPSVFGRSGEELAALQAAGVPFTIVPGVTAAAGAAAAAALSLTHRDHARALVLVTGHTKDGRTELDLPALCRPGQTLAFYMGHKDLPGLCGQLIGGGLPAATPAVLVENATLPDQRVLRATLASLPQLSAAVPFRGPALVLVGAVAGC